MRFGEHFCAARFYNRGISRGICVEIFWDLGFGAVGILVNGAQRAGLKRNGFRRGRLGRCPKPGYTVPRSPQPSNLRRGESKDEDEG
jgi:hypothetical protein